MNCRAYKEMLHSYASEELNEFDHAYVSEHLKDCEACSAELAEIRGLKLIAGSFKSEVFQLGDMKHNIMSIIQASKKKVLTYDIKVLKRVAASMVACGIIALMMNFTSLGYHIQGYAGQLSQHMEKNDIKVIQPMALLNKGLSEMSDRIIHMDGMMFNFQQKIEGGM